MPQEIIVQEAPANTSFGIPQPPAERNLANMPAAPASSNDNTPPAPRTEAVTAPMQEKEVTVNVNDKDPAVNQPTKESKDDNQLSLDDFEKDTVSTTTSSDKTKAQPKVRAVVKSMTPEAKVEKADRQGKVVAPATNIAPAKKADDDSTPPIPELPGVNGEHSNNKEADGRDYSAFSEEERPLLKKMGNEAFAFVSKELLRLRNAEKEFAKQKDARAAQVYADPNAFVLTPEYKALTEDASYYQFEEQHWKNQYIALRRGDKAVKDLTGYNDKGQPVFAEIPITPENQAQLEVALQSNLSAASAARQQAVGRVQQLAQLHQQRYSGAVDFIKQANTKYFGALMNPQHPRSKDINSFRNTQVPLEFREHPLAESLALAYGFILEVVNENKTLKQQQAAKQAIAQDRKDAGPTAATVNGGAGAKPVGAVLSMDDWKDDR